MIEIRRAEDFHRFGRHQGNTLVLNEGYEFVLQGKIKIPFSFKVTENTVFRGMNGTPAEMTFVTQRAAFCCSSSAEHLTLCDLSVRTIGDKELFKFQRNGMKDISIFNTKIDVLNFGQFSARSINIIDTEFVNAEQQPIVLDVINSLSLNHVEHYSKYPLFDLSAGKSIRDKIVISKTSTHGGLIIVGLQDDEMMLDLFHIPKHGIITRDMSIDNQALLKIRRTDGTILPLPAELVKQFFN